MACVALPQSRLESFEARLTREQDDLSVDRLIASCKPKARPLLPSAGRDLVPYFAPGSEHGPNQSLSEMGAKTRKPKAANSKTPSASALPRACFEKGQVQSAGKPAHSAGKPAQSAGKRSPPRKIRDSCKAPSVSKLASSKLVPNVTPAAVTPAAAVNKTWAGPSFYNSPAPESLPLPTAYLLAV